MVRKAGAVKEDMPRFWLKSTESGLRSRWEVGSGRRQQAYRML